MIRPGKSNKKHICFIINPISGRKRHKDISGLILKKIDGDQFEIEIKHSVYAGHARQLSKESVDKKNEIIVAVGGDGTINEVGRELINTNIKLGIVPIGSGNGLARHLGIPLSLPKALDLINKGIYIKIDTATINQIPFISIAGTGFDAHIAKIFSKSAKRGFFTYFGISIRKFFKYKPKHYTIRFDSGKKINTRALFISFANSNQFGYNTIISPHAKLTDGKLDICIVNKPKIFELPILANLLLLKKIDQSVLVQIIQSSGLTVEMKKDRIGNIDGEPVKLNRRLEIKVIPSSLKVIIPDHVKEK